MFIKSNCMGKVNIQLHEPYRTLLKATFSYFMPNDSVKLEEDTLHINCPESLLEILLDGLLFIKRYGSLKEGMMILTYGMSKVKQFYIQEGTMFVCEKMMQSNEPRKIINRKELFQKNERLFIKMEQKFFFENRIIEEVNRFTFFEYPLVPIRKEQEISTSYHFLRSYPIDPNEKRTIYFSGVKTMLWEPFMKLLVQEKQDQVCHYCIHRMRKITTGCLKCLPKKT